MSMEMIAFVFGVLLLSIGVVGGGFELKELKVPRVGRIARGASAVLGLVFIALGLALKMDLRPWPAPQPAAPVSSPASTAPPSMPLASLASGPAVPTVVPAVQPAAAPAPVPAPQPVSEPESAPAPEPIALAGEWKLVNTTVESSFTPFRGMQLGYRVFLQQDGRRVTGVGEKCWENGAELAHRSRTPIRIEGSIQGNTVVASFTEQGFKRSTSGQFVWKLGEDGALAGTFTSTAADSRGSSSGTRTGEPVS